MPTLTFGPKDAYSVMNSLVHQITGSTDITVTDTASFIDAGKTVLEAGYENLYNALGVLIGRTIIASRPYTGKFNLVSAESNAFDNRIRKISFYARDNQASGAFNTDLYTNLGAGLNDESGTGSQWEQNPAIPVEMHYFSDFVWDKSHSQYTEQAKIAFTNESEFIRFINGIMIEVQNDIESTLEAKNRSLVLDRIAGTRLMSDLENIGSESSVNLTYEFNQAHGTNYTTKQLLNDHTVAFLEFFIARVKNDSDMLTNRSVLFHDAKKKTISGTDYYVMRHTPKADQKFIFNSRLFTQINLSLAEIFNPNMLSLPNGEGIQYWQSLKHPYGIDIKPSLPEGEATSEVKMDCVVGMLFDRDALMANNKFNGMYATPINARHLYSTLWWHYKYGFMNDYTENCIIYYMEDAPEIYTDIFEGDGTEDDFTLTETPDTIKSVTVNGVAVASTGYSVSGKVVTFTTAPADDSKIVIRYTKSTS